jgi:hypothetical protein
MTKAKPKLLPFDAARYLTGDASIAEYINAVLETGEPDLLLLALGDVARARHGAGRQGRRPRARKSLQGPRSRREAAFRYGAQGRTRVGRAAFGACGGGAAMTGKYIGVGVRVEKAVEVSFLSN